MGVSIPKQYLDLGGRPLIEHALGLFLDHPQMSGVLVSLDSQDDYWPRTCFAEHPRIRRVDGGRERCQSVLNALDVLAEEADETDWVLVHDAARPCLRREDVDKLLTVLMDHQVGGLLGVPVRDTMKQVRADGGVRRTVSRDGLWHAFTPQMFRLGLLRRALISAATEASLVTDDAGAVERLGLEPLLVEGHADNIKITRPEDLPLAAFYLRCQGRLS